MRIARKFFPVIVIGLITCVLFYKVIFLDQLLYGTFDNFSYVIPLKYFFVNQIRHGIFPLWNPYVDIGVPYVGDMTIGTFSIFNIVYFLLPIPRAVSLLVVLSVFLIGVFQYVYLRALKVSQKGSLLGSLIFALGGSVFINIGAIDFISTVVYIPLIFLVLHQFATKKSLLYFFLLIALQSLQILNGHPRPSYYTELFVSLYLMFWTRLAIKKRIGICLIYWIFPILMASVQIFPLVENVIHSTRPLASLAFASSGSLTLAHLITFFFPTFFGSHKFGTWWGPQIELVGYLSIPGYLFLMYGIIKGKIFKKTFYIVGFFLSFLLALGRLSPVYLLFYYVVPGWKQFRGPIDIMIYFTFFASVIAACGFDYLLKNSQNISRHLKKLLVILLILFIPLAIIYKLASRKDFWANTLQETYDRFHLHILLKILIYDNQKIQVMFQGMLLNIVLFLLFFILLFLCFFLFSKKKEILGYLLLLLTSSIFLYYDNSIVMATSNIFQNTVSPAKLLIDAKNGEYRVVSLPVDLHQKHQHLAIPDFFYKESLAKLSVLEADNNIQQGIFQVHGFTTLVPYSYEKFIGSNPSNIIDIDFSHVLQNQLNLSSVKYILSNNPIHNPNLKLSLLAQKTGSYYVYKNNTALKRAYVLNNQQNSLITIKDTTTSELHIFVSTPQKTKLIVSNWFYPGWQAYVNGKIVQIQPYMNTFQMITIPKGRSFIKLIYKPMSFSLGLWVSFLSFCIFIVFLINLKNKKL